MTPGPLGAPGAARAEGVPTRGEHHPDLAGVANGALFCGAGALFYSLTHTNNVSTAEGLKKLAQRSIYETGRPEEGGWVSMISLKPSIHGSRGLWKGLSIRKPVVGQAF